MEYNIEEPHKDWIRDTRSTIDHTMGGTKFIKTNRLWEGFGQYRWLIKGGIIILIILGIDVVTSLPDLFSSNTDSTSEASTGSILNSLSLVSLEEYLGGGIKYVLLIAIEIIIFHFTRRSMMIITNDHIDTSFKTFIKAEKRMIRVAIFSFIMETIFRILSNTLLAIVGFEIAQGVMLFLIQSFYLGFAIIDNYNELYDMTLRQSHRYTWHFAPVAIITGAIVNVLMFIPALGIVIGTVICSVIATLTMHELTNREGGLDWVFVEKDKSR